MLLETTGLPRCLSGYRICLQYGRPGFNPWVGKIPWRSERLLTPVFWPGEFHGITKRRHNGATFTFTGPAVTFLLPTKERNVTEGNGRNGLGVILGVSVNFPNFRNFYFVLENWDY